MNTPATPTTMKWLIRREFWEHKGSMFWAPLIVAAVLLTLFVATAAWKISSEPGGFGVYVDGRPLDISNFGATLTDEQRQYFATIMAGSYLGGAAPLFLILPAVVFFYCLGALYDERRDRSILFWKSLPVSDSAAVLSKVATALLVAPGISIALATLTGLIMLLGVTILGIFQGVHLLGLLLATPQLYLTPFQLLALLPVYALWALPTVGYLLLISSWARSKVFLWAVGTPLIIAAVLAWVDYLAGGRAEAAGWFMEHIVGAGLGGLIPGVWLVGDDIPAQLLHAENRMVDMGRVVQYSYQSLADIKPWIGAAAGVLMLYGAMRLRRWRE